STAITNARSIYLSDGTEANDQMYDGTPVSPQEAAGPASPTTSPPADPGTPGPPADPVSAAPASSSAPAAPASGGSAPPANNGAGAPVDLWDTDWPQSGYYWTVVPVTTASGSSGSSTVAAPGASKGSALLPVNDPTQFSVGQSITIG